MGQYRMLVEKMYDEIKNLMKLMASDIANPNYWELEYEEVLASLHYKMAEVVWEYEDKPWRVLKGIVIKSLHNHKSTLTRRCYGTHRALELGIMDIDEVENELSNVMSDFLVSEFCEGLTEDAKMLVQDALYPAERTLFFIDLMFAKKAMNFSGGGWKAIITPLLMERALGWDSPRLTRAWDNVKHALKMYNSIPEDV